MNGDRTDYLLNIQEHMPEESKQALAYFVELNPRMQGAHWADALDMLASTDSNLEVTEFMYEQLRPIVPIDSIPYIELVTLTLLYANRGTPPEAEQVCNKLGFIAGRLDSKTRG